MHPWKLVLEKSFWHSSEFQFQENWKIKQNKQQPHFPHPCPSPHPNIKNGGRVEKKIEYLQVF